MENESKLLKTPLYNLSDEDLDNLYPPSEDTFLLIDALEKDLDFIVDLNPSICVEIGLGPGLVITALAKILGPSCKYFGTDINKLACEKAVETSRLNHVTLSTYNGDLASSLPDHVKGNIDVLIFNPPYVVTASEEVAAGNLESTWAGGVNGREVIDKLLPCVFNLLSQRGIFYLLLEKNNHPQEVVNVMEKYCFESKMILDRRASNEKLFVYRFSKNTSNSN